VRVAIGASALTIGLALVLVVTTYASGLRAATGAAIRQTFSGDLAIESADGTSPIPASSIQAAASVPGLASLSSLRTAQARLAGAGTVQVNGVEPTTWGTVYRFQWSQGSAADLAGLGVGDALVEADTARAAHLKVGGKTTLVTGSGQRVVVTIAGIYRDAGLLHGVTLDAAWFARLFQQPQLRATFVELTPGASRYAARAALQSALRAFPGVVVRSQAQLAARTESNVTSVIGLLYALLALSLVMSLAGIAGTMSLSVHERTRELGMLRAMGMTPEQARSLVRDESLISAAVGSLSGLVLGLVLAWAVVHALTPEGFVLRVPWTVVLAGFAAGLGAGVLASVIPGRRISRLNVLVAIAYE
jgi:putative ABC transport system permease protein